MKKLKCSDLGSADCHFEAEGETAAEVKEKMYAYAQEAHSDKLAGMSEDEKQMMDKKMDELLE